MSKYYTIKITGGTSQGPYTIYYDYINGPIATIYGTSNLAVDLTYTQLTSINGVVISVPENTNSIYLYNQYCQSGITLIPQKIIVYKDFCLQISNNRVIKNFHFIPSSFVNGFPSWEEETDNSITITYDGNQSRWVLNGFNNGGVIISYDFSTSNPPSDWEELGSSSTTSFDFKLGGCSSFRRSTFDVSINQPTCICDGSIIFNVNLDNPPFSYSIDNGSTYSSSPIYTNLCSGIYVLSIVDSLGDTFSKTVTLNKATMTTTYNISLSTILTTPVVNEISLVNSYQTTINVNPPLPNGASITFDLIHTNSFYSSPASGTSVLTTGTVLSKNSSTVLIDTTTTGQTQFVNTTPGCQNEYIFQSNINDIWNSLTLTNSDTITISTTSRVDKTTTGLCVVGYSNDTYSIANAILSGCDCCTLIIT